MNKADVRRYLQKRAGVYSDIGVSLVPRALIPYGLGDTAHTIGQTAGALTANELSDKDAEKLAKELAKQKLAWDLVPGVGGYRIGQKAMLNARKNNKETALMNVLGEQYGAIPTFLAGGLLGGVAGGIGGGIVGNKYDLTGSPNSEDPDVKMASRALGINLGASLGILVGGAMPILVSGALAFIRRRRTAEEQKAHDQSANIGNWLIPGMSTYNAYKRLGRIHAEESEDEED